MPVLFLRPAYDEMNAAARFYESKSPNLGKRFLTEIQHTSERISERPNLSKKIRGDIRRRFVKGFPYALLYTVETEEIIIIAVMHLRRDPAYWTSRFKR